jgi:hypothetical protein
MIGSHFCGSAPSRIRLGIATEAWSFGKPGQAEAIDELLRVKLASATHPLGKMEIWF